MYKETANAILKEPVKVSITTYKRGRFFNKKVEKEFEVKALCFGSVVRISRILLDFEDLMKLPTTNMIGASYVAAQKHTRAMAEIVVIGFTNTKKDPDQALIDLIELNLTSHQLSEVVIQILKQIDVSQFIKFYKLNKKKDDDEDDSDELHSLWTTLGGLIKYFRFSWDELMWEMSYANALMLSATIPKYDFKKKDKDKNNVEEEVEEVGPVELNKYLNLK